MRSWGLVGQRVRTKDDNTAAQLPLADSHIYGVSFGWKLLFTAGGTALVLMGILLMRYGVATFRIRWSSALPGGLVLIALGIWTCLNALIYRVILEENAITAVSFNLGTYYAYSAQRRPRTFGIDRRVLFRAAISGVLRLPTPQRTFPILVFLPKDPSDDALYIYPQFLQTDEVFDQWCRTLPELDLENEEVVQRLAAGRFSAASARNARTLRRLAARMKSGVPPDWS